MNVLIVLALLVAIVTTSTSTTVWATTDNSTATASASASEPEPEPLECPDGQIPSDDDPPVCIEEEPAEDDDTKDKDDDNGKDDGDDKDKVIVKVKEIHEKSDSGDKFDDVRMGVLGIGTDGDGKICLVNEDETQIQCEDFKVESELDKPIAEIITFN